MEFQTHRLRGEYSEQQPFHLSECGAAGERMGVLLAFMGMAMDVWRL